MLKNLVVAALLLTSSGAAWAEPILGHTLVQALRTDLFTHFSLEEEAPSANGTHTYRPHADLFKYLVVVTVSTNGDKIDSMKLNVARTFVEDTANGIFARDLTKSFLLEAVPPADQFRYTGFLDSLWKRVPGGGPGYEVYLGKKDSWSDNGDASFVEMSNSNGQFELSVSAK